MDHDHDHVWTRVEGRATSSTLLCLCLWSSVLTLSRLACIRSYVGVGGGPTSAINLPGLSNRSTRRRSSHVEAISSDAPRSSSRAIAPLVFPGAAERVAEASLSRCLTSRASQPRDKNYPAPWRSCSADLYSRARCCRVLLDYRFLALLSRPTIICKGSCRDS